MNQRSWIRSCSARARLAQLVIAVSAVVALASSNPDQQVGVLAQQQIRLELVEHDERGALASFELAGKLYTNASWGTVQIIATADRTASDLELSVRALEPRSEASAPAESLPQDEADVPAGLAEAGSIATARADVRTPNVVSLSLPLECVDGAAAARRAESCAEQFEITLRRDSKRPLTVDLEVLVSAGGGGEWHDPRGAVELTLEELVP